MGVADLEAGRFLMWPDGVAGDGISQQVGTGGTDCVRSKGERQDPYETTESTHPLTFFPASNQVVRYADDRKYNNEKVQPCRPSVRPGPSIEVIPGENAQADKNC